MFKKGTKHVVIGKAGRMRAFDTLLLPNGERALLLDQEVYQRARDAADQKFEEAVEKMRVGSEQRTRGRAV